MGNDFFTELGKTFTKTAKELEKKTDSFLEQQKIRNKISSETRMIDKIYQDMGMVIYQKYISGEVLSEDMAALCDDITERKTAVAAYYEELARLKGEKICPSCGANIQGDACYCPKCGEHIEEPQQEPGYARETGDAQDAEFKECEEMMDEGETGDAPKPQEPLEGETDNTEN